MASSLDSLDLAGSPLKPGSSVIHLCMSVKRTVYGSSSGNLSVSAMAISSKLSQSSAGGMSVIQLLGVVFIPFGNFHDDVGGSVGNSLDRKSTRLNSSHTVISYAVFCLKKKTKK